MLLALAGLVAVVHGAVVLLLVAGGLLGLRWPALLRLHVPVALAVLAVALAGADCPLTDLELALRERAGAPPLSGGFLGAHVLEPLGADRADLATQVAVHAVAVLPNAVAYGLLLARRGSRRRRGTAAA